MGIPSNRCWIAPKNGQLKSIIWYTVRYHGLEINALRIFPSYFISMKWTSFFKISFTSSFANTSPLSLISATQANYKAMRNIKSWLAWEYTYEFQKQALFRLVQRHFTSKFLIQCYPLTIQPNWKTIKCRLSTTYALVKAKKQKKTIWERENFLDFIKPCCISVWLFNIYIEVYHKKSSFCDLDKWNSIKTTYKK